MAAALKEYRRSLQCELNVFAYFVFQIDLWDIDPVSFGRCSNMIAKLFSHFPFPGVPGSSVIIGGPPWPNAIRATDATNIATC